MNQHELPLHEAYMLLALRDEKGTIESKASFYAYGLGGAMLTELAVAERVRIDEGRKGRVDCIDATPIGAPLLDEALAMIESSRPRPARHWVAKFSRISGLRHRVAELLCDRGVLRKEDKAVLKIFSRLTYPTVDPAPEQRILEAMRRAIFEDSAVDESRVLALVALADATRLLRIHFSRRELATRKARLKEIAAGEHGSRAARQAVKAAQQAATAAVVIATTTATS